MISIRICKFLQFLFTWTNEPQIHIQIVWKLKVHHVECSSCVPAHILWFWIFLSMDFNGLGSWGFQGTRMDASKPFKIVQNQWIESQGLFEQNEQFLCHLTGHAEISKFSFFHKRKTVFYSLAPDFILNKICWSGSGCDGQMSGSHQAIFVKVTQWRFRLVP